MEIRQLTSQDWPAVKEIYQLGIATGHATFQTEAPQWEEWNSSHLPHCRLAIEKENLMIGWAALSAVSSRAVYAGVGEVSVYIHPDYFGKGFGSTLLQALVAASDQQGVWTLQSSIFRENIGSLRIHEKAGFRLVGYREKIGKMNGIWRDTLLLERRNPSIQ